ncbi:hypothetical protein AKO1_015821 [Acrasis kona]|uniref:Eukaryotic translation initiation factor 3 subunit E n=1 Tax=Acrasis kona TaxID=1008807 RepID=A0AAW2ZFT8_9EUKA
MTEYDLTQKVTPFLDSHLVLPLLGFLRGDSVDIYAKADVLKAELDVLQKTKMQDTIIDVYKVVNKDSQVPDEMTQERDEIKNNIANLLKTCKPLMDVLQDEQTVKDLRTNNDFSLSNIKGVDISVLDSFYSLARLKYQTGQYEDAAAMLYDAKLLYQAEQGIEAQDKAYRAAWGKLASEILASIKSGQWDVASEDLNELREIIDARQFDSNLQQLEHRSWWIHWSLFVFWNHPNGRSGIIDQFFLEKYLSVIQNSCPWVLRYLAVAVVINKRRRSQLKDLVKVIEQESNTYSDPVLKFLANLYIKVDFEGAQSELPACSKVLANDYFLHSFVADFLENSRVFIFESYAKIHKVIDLDSLSQRLGVDVTEKWVANLIRNARYSAKIYSDEKRVVMAEQSPNIYQQIVERTEGATNRSNILQKNVLNLEKRLKAQTVKE